MSARDVTAVTTKPRKFERYWLDASFKDAAVAPDYSPGGVGIWSAAGEDRGVEPVNSPRYNYCPQTQRQRRFANRCKLCFHGPSFLVLLSRWTLDFLTAFLFLCTAVSVYNAIVYPRISPLRHLPTPEQPPLWRRFFKEPTPWLFEQWMKEISNEGLIRYFGIFNQERLLLTNSDGVRDVLVTNPYHFHKQRAQKVHLEPVLGRGLVFVEEDEHKFHRKQMSPAFAVKRIRDCQPIFWQKTKEIVDIFSRQISLQSDSKSLIMSHQNKVAYELTKKTDVAVRIAAKESESSDESLSRTSSIDADDKARVSGIVEVHDPVSRAALDIIGLAGCSFDFDSLKKDESQNKMVRDYRKAFGVSTSNRIRCLLAHAVPAWFVDNVPIERNKDIAIVTRLVGNLARSIIGEKRRNHSEAKLNPDFLDKVMQSGGFTDKVLIEQVKTLLAAGHDTTSSTLASAAATLSEPRYHYIQDKLRAEIREKLPSLSSSTLASSTKIEKLPYLNAVRDEILRLFPPFSWYFRRSVVATSICNHAIPAGNDIIFCPWGMARLTSHWGSDAEDFNPERWLDDRTGRGGAKDAYCFNTFGAGPRVCIAEKFARNEISTLMAGIFGSFRVEQAEGVGQSPLSHQLTLTRIGGVKVRMTPVEGW